MIKERIGEKNKKEEIQSQYEYEKDDLEWQKEQTEFDRQTRRELDRQERANASIRIVGGIVYAHQVLLQQFFFLSFGHKGHF